MSIPTTDPGQIGPYKILRPLGEGGMGVVYEAEQDEPVHRRVALKLIKLGMDTKQVVARFEAERQALAVMDHRSIAKVFDGGSTEDGRPFFVMELVKGTPITDYCDTHTLSTAARLELVAEVCGAVQHAHQKGVIHRDLKPSNVLVTVQGDRAVPKVIDFGIAKAVGQDLTDRTLVTRVGQLMGTPEYMSPEQAEMSELGIDTRTDVYALGVLLYELLVGALPHEFGRAADVVVQTVIRFKNPVRPSQRLTAFSEDQREHVAQRRLTDPGSLRRALHGDLDWIVMKCLEKDRTRRYDTAKGLADDLGRYVAGEPVTARPPSASYRLGKFVRRNRLAVTAVAAVGAALLIGLATTLWQWQRSITAREAMAAALAETNATSRFAFGLFEASNPYVEERGDTVSARTLLERGARRVRNELSLQPRLRSRMLGEIGNVYANLGLLPAADSLISEAFSTWSTDVSDSDSVAAALLDDWSTVKSSRGENDTASALGHRALDRWRELYGDDHLATANSMSNLAVVHYYLGEYDQGLEMGLEALAVRRRELGDDHADVAEAMDNTAAHLQALGRMEDATRMRVDAVATARRAHGNRHPAVATPLQNLAVLLGELDRWDEAELHLREAIDIRTDLLGADHPELGYAYHNLGVNLDRQGKQEEALPIYAEALRVKELNLGRVTSYARTLEQLAGAYASLERYSESAELYDQVEAVYRSDGADPVDLAFVDNYRGELLLKQERYADALAPLQTAYESALGIFGENHPRTAQFGGNLGVCLAGLGQTDEARTLLEASLQVFLDAFGDGHGMVRLAQERLDGLD